MNVAAIAAAGYATAVRRFDASAQRVARAGEPASDVDLANEAVEQVGATHAAAANLVAMKTADETVRKLLDIKV